METSEALLGCFISPNELDRNREPANIVDGLFAIARAISDLTVATHRLGVNDASTPMGAIESLGQVLKEGVSIRLDEPIQVRVED